MDTADPQNRSEWRGRLRKRLVKQVQPSVEDKDYKTDMMMMMDVKSQNIVYEFMKKHVLSCCCMLACHFDGGVTFILLQSHT